MTINSKIKTSVMLAFEEEFWSVDEKKGKANQAHRHLLAAVRCGWVDMTEKQLEEMPVGDMLRLFDEWYIVYVEVMNVDPN